MSDVVGSVGRVPGPPAAAAVVSDPRTTPLTAVLPGATVAKLATMGLHSVLDLLDHLPRRLVERGSLTDLAALKIGAPVTVQARVRSIGSRRLPGRTSRGKERWMTTAVLEDAAGTTLQLVWFNQPWQEKRLAAGRWGLFAGTVGIHGRQRQLANPEFVLERAPATDATGTAGAAAGPDAAAAGIDGPAEDADGIEDSELQFDERFVPVYPASAEFTSWKVAAAVRMVLDRTTVADHLPTDLVTDLGLAGLDEAYRLVHRPTSREDDERGRERLRHDEAFVPQLALARRRWETSRTPAVPRPGRDGGLLDAFDAALPFRLTPAQEEVGRLLRTELARSAPMHRLLEGEVGSGKTVVALRAMLTVVDSGAQAVLLAPTEALAQQHARSLNTLLGPLAEVGRFGGADLFGNGSAAATTRVTLLVGSLSVPDRRRALLEIAAGVAGLVVGTHALLQDRVSFAELGLVVVDEQHRFGVEQRAALTAPVAGSAPHLLVMTATPIPRTVAMTVFGDLDHVTLDGTPGTRSRVTTTVVPVLEAPRWLDRAWDRLREEVDAGHQGFVVFPRIGDPPGRASAATTGPELHAPAGPELHAPAGAELHAAAGAELHAAAGAAPAASAGESLVGSTGGAALEAAAPGLVAGRLAGIRTAVVHGRLPPEARDAVLRAFAAGTVDVLLCTTVVEVGIDVPNATTMIVVDADRFGVSQLHQLRGRVGRSAAGGVCLLLTAAETGSPGRIRTDAVAATSDGRELARLDLRQRREGDVLGATQAGRSRFRLLDILDDGDVIHAAKAAAEELLAGAVAAGDADLTRYPLLLGRLSTLTDPGDDEYLEKS